MLIFEKKSDAHKYLCETVQNKVKDGEVCEKLEPDYPRFTQWLEREYPGATSWQSNSLWFAVESWAFYSWGGYAEYVGYPPRTCQRYAVKGQDYKCFRGRFAACPDSADQFRFELDHGLRGNRSRLK
jgi:hypothetical protein